MKLQEILGAGDNIEVLSKLIQKKVQPATIRTRWMGDLPTLWMTLTPEISAKVAYHPGADEDAWYATVNDVKTKEKLADVSGNEADVLALLMKYKA